MASIEIAGLRIGVPIVAGVVGGVVGWVAQDSFCDFVGKRPWMMPVATGLVGVGLGYFLTKGLGAA
jgi:hypothetical protein